MQATFNKRHLLLCLNFTIFPLDLLGLAEKPMASLSSSKGKIVKWDTFQISGSKHNCLLLPVIQADDQARLAPCICIVKYVNVVQLIDENDFWIMDKTKYFSLGVLGICLKKKEILFDQCVESVLFVTGWAGTGQPCSCASSLCATGAGAAGARP